METLDIQALIEAYGDGGWLAVAAMTVTVAVRVWRKPAVQGRLPAKLRWKVIPPLAQWGIIGLGALIASVLTGLAAGVGWSAALSAAVPVALAAVCGHKATKAVGHARTAKVVEDAARRGLKYEPGSIRRALDVVLPLDRKVIDAVD
jgi:hypothetical protein